MSKLLVNNIVALAVAACFASGCASPDAEDYSSPSTHSTAHSTHSTPAHSTHSTARSTHSTAHSTHSTAHSAHSGVDVAGSYSSVAMIRAAGGVVIQRGQIMRIILPYAKFFDQYNANQIQVSKRSALYSVSKLLNKNYSRSPIRVIGFTDASGTHVEQVARAKRTAEVIYSYLWDHGVNPRRMSLISGGSSEPLGSDAGFFAGWSDNRRVEVRVGLPTS